MRKSFKKIVVVSLFVIAGLVGWNACSTNNGIIALDGYEDGVLICGEGWSDDMPDYREIEGVVHEYNVNGHYMAINWGHNKDVEVDILRGLGAVMCLQYLVK